MKDVDEYTDDELMHISHNMSEKILFVILLIFCLIPWAMDRNSMYVTSLRETVALYNTYETLDASVIDLTAGNGQVYEDVKTVYVHDNSNAKWIAKNPDKGCWVTEDNRVIVQKGNCYAVQVASDIETGGTQ